MCGKSSGINRTELVTRLVATVNKHPDLEIKTNPGEAVVKKEKNGGYLVTLKNVSIEISYANILQFTDRSAIIKTAPVHRLFPFKTKEILLFYHPGKKHLAVKQIKGLSLKFTKEETLGTSEYTFDRGWLKIEGFTKRIVYKNADVSNLLNPKSKYSPLAVRRTSQKNLENIDTKSYGFRISMDGGTGAQKMFSFILKAKTFRARNKRNSIEDKRIEPYFTSKNITPLDLKKIRIAGKSLTHETLEISDFEFALYIKGRKRAHGTLEKLSFTHFLKPGRDRKFFEFGFHLGLHTPKTTFPGNPMIEWLANVDECHFGICFGHLNDECVHSTYKLLNWAVKKRGMSKPYPKDPFTFMRWLQVFDNLIKSNFEFKVYIKPYKHKCGEGFFDYKIKIHDGNRTEASFSLGFKNPGGFIAGMESAGFLPPQFTMGLRQMFLLMGRKDDEGYKTITYHLNSDQLKTLLNLSAANSFSMN